MRSISSLTALVLLLSAAGSSSPGHASSYAIRGVYGPGAYADEAAQGFSVLDTGPDRSTLESLPPGTKSWVWLQNYDNTTCTFQASNAWVTSHVRDIQADADRIAAYYVADEPDPSACPSAPMQIAARTALIRSIDPDATARPTFITSYRPMQYRVWKGAVDVVALDRYPCSIATQACRYWVIDQQAQMADEAGIRYWGVVQAFGDGYYRLPTPDELHQEFLHWRSTNMEGYLVFAWKWPKDNPTLWLANHPDVLAQLQGENGI